MLERPHPRLRRAVSAYADGELDAATAQALAAHLLECHGCSHDLAVVLAIKGSLQRLANAEPSPLAAKRLRRWAANLEGREAASPGLRDEVRLAVHAASDTPSGARVLVGKGGRSRIRARAGALAGLVAVITATGVLLLHRQGPSPDPAAVAAIVELARIEPPTPPPNGGRAEELRGGMLELGGQKVWLARHLVDGREVLVATSDRAFPMPADARPLGRERGAPWLAMRGDTGIACLSRPTHMLLAGHLPAERLVEIGRQLGPL
jgi:hypothetical protein